jgi:hypothetical protein
LIFHSSTVSCTFFSCSFHVVLRIFQGTLAYTTMKKLTS